VQRCVRASTWGPSSQQQDSAACHQVSHPLIHHSRCGLQALVYLLMSWAGIQVTSSMAAGEKSTGQDLYRNLFEAGGQEAHD
jgi:hypothetical protein